MVAEGIFATANLESYCAAEEVLSLVGAYDTSDWATDEELLAEITGMLAATKSAIDSAAGRDFMLHADETVLLDGSGTRVMLLAPQGIAPVVGVNSVSVEGVALDESDWLFYQDEAAIVLANSADMGGCFPEGRQNVEVTLDWGYEVTPSEIRSAQAKLTAAELLAKYSGEQEGVEAVGLGDYNVRYASAGRFSGTIRRLVAEAREVVARYRRIDFCAI